MLRHSSGKGDYHMSNYDDREVTFEIVEEIGVISAHSTGWAKEINLVSWNGGPPKYDIREWSPAHDQMSRGITLNEKEMRLIIELLRRRSRSRGRRNRSGWSRGQDGREDGTGYETAADQGMRELRQTESDQDWNPQAADAAGYEGNESNGLENLSQYDSLSEDADEAGLTAEVAEDQINELEESA